jgi:Ni,Fe-hydrogenase maturation factor
MTRPDSRRPPIAVVALGDPNRHDDAVAVRVMGRVRTLVGEIGLARQRGRVRTADATTATALAAAEPAAGSLIQWVEGGADPDRLDAVLDNRRRVVLIDALRTAGRPGTVHHWHLRCDPRHRLSRIRHYNGKSSLGLQHLALWLEDELPEHGTDLIGIRVSDLREGEGLSRPVRRLLPSICAQVAGIMIRILEDEGW